MNKTLKKAFKKAIKAQGWTKEIYEDLITLKYIDGVTDEDIEELRAYAEELGYDTTNPTDGE